LEPVSGLVAIVLAVAIAALGVVAAGVVLRVTALKPPFDFGAVDALIGIVYGILLAILVLFASGHYTAAVDHANQEATALNDMYKSAGVLPTASRDRIRHDIVCYAREKIDLEWPVLRKSKGDGSPVVFARTRQLSQEIEDLARAEPRDLTVATLFDANLQRGTARQLMLEDARPELPAPLWVVVLLGVGIVMFLLSLRYWTERSHLVAACAVSLLLLVAMIGAIAELDRPFARIIGQQPRAMETVLTNVVQSSSGSAAALRPCTDPKV
jgi:Protein of unknown function (DUF4239)